MCDIVGTEGSTENGRGVPRGGGVVIEGGRGGIHRVNDFGGRGEGIVGSKRGRSGFFGFRKGVFGGFCEETLIFCQFFGFDFDTVAALRVVDEVVIWGGAFPGVLEGRLVGLQRGNELGDGVLSGGEEGFVFEGMARGGGLREVAGSFSGGRGEGDGDLGNGDSFLFGGGRELFVPKFSFLFFAWFAWREMFSLMRGSL